MTAITYNLALAIGLALVGAGVALVSVPAALTTVGALVIALTLFGAAMARRK
uniref:hypothetical protein n=1 Tax=Cupriavidus taiwanensis TaxID=164546 RepID=UPI0018DC3A33|nr:hypothetical protein [Cupriavidus taiwanensis]